MKRLLQSASWMSFWSYTLFLIPAIPLTLHQNLLCIILRFLLPQHFFQLKIILPQLGFLSLPFFFYLFKQYNSLFCFKNLFLTIKSIKGFNWFSGIPVFFDIPLNVLSLSLRVKIIMFWNNAVAFFV